MSDVLTKEEREFYDDALAGAALRCLTIRGTIFALGVIDRLASEVERLRRELAELRKPVEVLSDEVECELRCLRMYEVDNDSDLDDLRTAILKFANERGGGA